MSQKSDRVNTIVNDDGVSFTFSSRKLTAQDLRNANISIDELEKLEKSMIEEITLGEIKFAELDDITTKSMLFYGIKQWVNDGGAKSRGKNTNEAEHLIARFQGIKKRISLIKSGNVELGQGTASNNFYRFLKRLPQFESLTLKDIETYFLELPSDRQQKLKQHNKDVMELTKDIDW